MCSQRDIIVFTLDDDIEMNTVSIFTNEEAGRAHATVRQRRGGLAGKEIEEMDE